ncbi:MAG TPA: 3-isopropylmalate dehydratase large subunit [Candidatus Pacearchaeota archaeon]|nr:3-isopropylmalate dehydratase large subunit [archaeon BMS3Abin17]HDK42776.1 3-isopropylmalate dehydratase large subunit [Candidatus Pacearchaeota archaeon]HDZ61049.1 3-isopropylmalate dehydratase large subunit [Candidatus Pacearchaeota archaeon]
MSQKTLYDKVWKKHIVGELPTGQTQVFVSRHMMHEVTSPQAFEMLREKKISVKHPELTFCILDHVIPTHDLSRPFEDNQAELMTSTVEENTKEFNITYFGPGSGKQGVCHVAFPEQGLIWPGQIIVCGDSHTCTYGAFGTLAFGIGTTQVSHVLATQTLAMDKLKVRRINFNGKLNKGVGAKDLALYMIMKLGVKGGVGFAYEFGGEAIENMSMEERMTICNLAVEGGARLGYINPDKITFDYLKEKEFAPKKYFEKAVEYWKSIASDSDAQYDDVVDIDVPQVEPMVTWGVNPEQTIGVSEIIPSSNKFEGKLKEEAEDALNYMGLNAGDKIEGTPVDVVFIGSCTNGRLIDFKQAAEILKGKKVAVKTLVVSGSEEVKKQAEEIGIDKIFIDAGAEWRLPGCSMCLAMNPDKLVGTQRCASTSNRNFKGRQGSPTGRTHLMNPYTAAASAIEGKITNPGKYLGGYPLKGIKKNE